MLAVFIKLRLLVVFRVTRASVSNALVGFRVTHVSSCVFFVRFRVTRPPSLRIHFCFALRHCLALRHFSFIF